MWPRSSHRQRLLGEAATAWRGSAALEPGSFAEVLQLCARVRLPAEMETSMRYAGRAAAFSTSPKGSRLL